MGKNREKIMKKFVSKNASFIRETPFSFFYKTVSIFLGTCLAYLYKTEYAY